MTNFKLFPIRNWDNKWYTSADDLHSSYKNGNINMQVNPMGHGLHWSESLYTFTTKEGIFIAEFTKYSDYGFSSQAYGIEIKTANELFKSL